MYKTLRHLLFSVYIVLHGCSILSLSSLLLTVSSAFSSKLTNDVSVLPSCVHTVRCLDYLVVVVVFELNCLIYLC